MRSPIKTHSNRCSLQPVYASSSFLVLRLLLDTAHDRRAVKNIFLDATLIAPNAAGVILRARDYGVAAVIEGTREYVVLVTIQDLHLGAGISVPHAACLV